LRNSDEKYYRWHSQHLGRDFEMLVFGASGRPVLLFPPAQGRFYDAKDSNLIQSLDDLIDEGKLKIYCPDSIDSLSWYNFGISPQERVKTHEAYEQVILHDVLEFALHETGFKKVSVIGCGFGGYHASNTALKYPYKFDSIISLSGFFDIKQFIFGYYDDDCYFNNPSDYLPNLEDLWYLDRIRKMRIILGVGENDFTLEENKIFSKLLSSKNIPHLLDIRSAESYGWEFWRKILPEYINRIITLSES
jgi:esterase/lipase superfamily enzyme